MGEKNDIKSINEDIARRFSSIADKLKQAPILLIYWKRF